LVREMLKVSREILDCVTHRASRSSFNEIALKPQIRLIAHELLHT
jgi:hypothetical protein